MSLIDWLIVKDICYDYVSSFEMYVEIILVHPIPGIVHECM